MSTALRILDEDCLELDGVCELLRCSPATAYRAFHRGLEHLHTGPKRRGKIITSRQAVERYLAKLNGIDLQAADTAEASPLRTKRRQRELDRVDAELAAVGL